jgi:predicted patatin/cPLA2 family phospholipase
MLHCLKGFHPPYLSFTFYSTVNELDSIIHTLKKEVKYYQQVLKQLLKLQEEKKKVLFTVKADWHGINTHDLGLLSTMLY